MTRLEKLEQTAYEHDIEIYECALPENKSVSIELDGAMAIGINPEQFANSAERLVHFAHEMGHCETGSFYRAYSPLQTREKCEYRAKVWAIKKLVPRKNLERAIRKGYMDLWELAEYFDVTPDFIRQAFDYYSTVA